MNDALWEQALSAACRTVARQQSAVLDAPASPRRLRRLRRPLAAAAVAAAAVCTFSLAAYGVAEASHRFALLAESSALSTPQYAVILGQPAAGGEKQISGDSAKILAPEYLAADSSFSFSGITTLAGQQSEQGLSLADFVYNNGEVVIFTQENGEGWPLDAGEALTISFRQDAAANPSADPTGDRMTLGIVENGVPRALTDADGLSTLYTYTASESGVYYFYLQNASAGQIAVVDISLLQLNVQGGSAQVEAVYADGAQLLSDDGYPVWRVVSSDDPELPVGSYVVVDTATKAFAVIAPPADSTRNTFTLPAGSAADGLCAPLESYSHWEGDDARLTVYAESGTPLYALAAGTVTAAGYNAAGSGSGYAFTVQCPDGSSYTHTHCATLLAAVGDTVTAGQQVATVGATGMADRPMCTIYAPEDWMLSGFFA